MGMGATNTMDRVAASIGAICNVPISFTPCMDIPSGGVLLALPALLAVGLISYTRDFFKWKRGYYALLSIFLLLAFMALSRIKTIESLRYYAPGEWGKLLGLDRIPEARTLRRKIKWLSAGGQPQKWSARLCAEWMGADPESAGTLYIDGHVRVYHGYKTMLPRHYIARQRLCLRAETDYWVNAMDSQPFFVITKTVDPGLLQTLRDDIVPRLTAEVPGQPSLEQLSENPFLHRFTLVFDREGYSPDFLLEMKKERVACLTYHKHQGEDWPHGEFKVLRVPFSNGNIIEMKLAERGLHLSANIWLREIRKLTDSGHQTSILSTDYVSDIAPIAAAMFSRWSQENFFKYMREHYNLDRLSGYNLSPVSDTTRVVNPEYRSLDSQIRSKTSILSRKLAQFGAMSLEGDIDRKKVGGYQKKKADMQEEIQNLQGEVTGIKEKRKSIAHHISVSELPEGDRFRALGTESRHLIDTIKMAAYRAETAMAHVLREKMSRNDDAHSLLRAIYRTEADLLPDHEKCILTVRLHHLANRSSDDVIRHLCDELNATGTIFPGTNLRMFYEPVS
jgi:predicted  nucleic acid-binding Zn-ribbon protein